MASGAGRLRVEMHVELFNGCVVGDDWSTFARAFAEDARMTFSGAPAGHYKGRAEIEAAYRSDPPVDTLRVVEVRTEDDVDVVDVAWSRGGPGTMRLGWSTSGLVQRLDIVLDR
ncbi:MAG: hypothetical protein ACRDO7_04955 [Nocardioidaceae bacterium]